MGVELRQEELQHKHNNNHDSPDNPDNPSNPSNPSPSPSIPETRDRNLQSPDSPSNPSNPSSPSSSSNPGSPGRRRSTRDRRSRSKPRLSLSISDVEPPDACPCACKLGIFKALLRLSLAVLELHEARLLAACPDDVLPMLRFFHDLSYNPSKHGDPPSTTPNEAELSRSVLNTCFDYFVF